MVIDPNTVLSLPAAFQGFKSIAGQGGQVPQFDRCFKAI
jgi:hypothetical protein